jgi:F0F1-type ATP synthase membrane subunit b/b'
MQKWQKILGFTIIWASNGTASSDHGINWWHLGTQYKDSPALGWLIITFLIFVYAIARAIKKPLALYLETRAKDISQKIQEGFLAKKESEEKLATYEKKLQSLNLEIEKLRTAFSEQALSEKKERERSAQEMRDRILRDAEDTIKANFERSKNRLADEVINKAMILAEEKIVKEKQIQMDEFLKVRFIKELETNATGIH